MQRVSQALGAPARQWLVSRYVGNLTRLLLARCSLFGQCGISDSGWLRQEGGLFRSTARKVQN
jgi:hypothetical protein